jgi:hypothetical protein
MSCDRSRVSRTAKLRASGVAKPRSSTGRGHAIGGAFAWTAGSWHLFLLIRLCEPAVAQEPAKAPLPELLRVTGKRSCPSEDFDKFLPAFAEREDLQRRFTHLPLKYGGYDDDFNLFKRDIGAFEKIPTRDQEGSGLIFPNKAARVEGNTRRNE